MPISTVTAALDSKAMTSATTATALAAAMLAAASSSGDAGRMAAVIWSTSRVL